MATAAATVTATVAKPDSNTGAKIVTVGDEPLASGNTCWVATTVGTAAGSDAVATLVNPPRDKPLSGVCVRQSRLSAFRV